MDGGAATVSIVDDAPEVRVTPSRVSIDHTIRASARPKLHSKGLTLGCSKADPTARELLHQPAPTVTVDTGAVATEASVRHTFVCRHCGAPMILLETFARGHHIRGPPRSSSPP